MFLDAIDLLRQPKRRLPGIDCRRRCSWHRPPWVVLAHSTAARPFSASRSAWARERWPSALISFSHGQWLAISLLHRRVRPPRWEAPRTQQHPPPSSSQGHGSTPGPMLCPFRRRTLRC